MSLYSNLKTVNPSGFDASKGIHFNTSYVGVMVLGIGATLEIIGYISTLPWRTSNNSN
jgi:hypothetical protein